VQTNSRLQIRSALLGAVLAAAACGPSAHLNHLAPVQASHYIGQMVTVEGTVLRVTVERQPNTTFLNFDAGFRAVILTTAANQFPNPIQWEGRRVRVTGTVELYEGRPVIILEQPSQLTRVAHSS
jgi:DNA/RNA endonuclease YhcR with UshA esterase domain